MKHFCQHLDLHKRALAAVSDSHLPISPDREGCTSATIQAASLLESWKLHPTATVEFKLLGIDKMLPLGIDTANRAWRTPQIPGSQLEQAPGVVGSIRNLESLSKPQGALASGGVRVRKSILRLACQGTKRKESHVAGPCGTAPCASTSGISRQTGVMMGDLQCKAMTRRCLLNCGWL